MEQQKEAGMIGMWIFLVTEVMFFGGLFLAYTIYRTIYPEGFLYGSHLLNVKLGFTNTMVLIISSLTMAMAVYYSQKGERVVPATRDEISELIRKRSDASQRWKRQLVVGASLQDLETALITETPEWPWTPSVGRATREITRHSSILSVSSKTGG